METSSNKNLTILILSCSSYSDLWSNNLECLNKFWPNHPNVVISSDGEGIYNVSKFEELKIYEGNMSDRLFEAIDDIKTKYILLTFDDYFLNKKVKNDAIFDIIQYLETNNFSSCRLYKKPKIRNSIYIDSSKYISLPLNNTYELNFYPTIWNKNALLSIIVKGEDIWKSEVRLTKRAKKEKFHALALKNNSVFHFVDIVRKGKYLKSAHRFMKKNNLYISNRKIRSSKETFLLAMQTFASTYFPKKMKEYIKKKMRKKGMIFYSDYANTDD